MPGYGYDHPGIVALEQEHGTDKKNPGTKPGSGSFSRGDRKYRLVQMSHLVKMNIHLFKVSE